MRVARRVREGARGRRPVATPAPRPRAYLTFLLITRIATWLRLSRREETWKTAEILILRHQLAVLQRRQPHRPKLNWADRALLAALLAVIPESAPPGMAAAGHPETILRLHRDIIRRRWAARSTRGRTGRPPTRRHIRALVLRLARENPEWVATPAVWEILKTSGVDPAPLRRPWRVPKSPPGL